MKKETWNFIRVLQTAMTGELYELNDPDEKMLLDLAKEQYLFPLFVLGYEKYPAFQFSADKEKIRQKVYAMTAAQINRNFVFSDIYNKMVFAGLCPVVVKGIVCRYTYDEFGDYRPSSDEDIFISFEDYPKYTELLKNEGFLPEIPEQMKADVRDLQEIAFQKSDGSLRLEIHPSWFGEVKKKADEYNAVFRDAVYHLTVIEIDGVKYTTLSHTMHYLYLFFHLAKHFSEAGVGIRQAMDLVMYKRMYEEEIDFAEVEKTISAYGLKQFYTDVLAIGRCIVYGEDVCKEVVELLEDSLAGGIYGNASKAHAKSAVFTVGEHRKNPISKKLYMVFPPYQKMKLGYPYILDRPWLLPAAWVNRLYRIIHTYGKDMTKEAYQIAKLRRKLMKRYGFAEND